MADGVTKGHCPSCGPGRNANVVGFHKENSKDEDIWESTEYRILKCLGCGSVYFQQTSYHSEMCEETEDGKLELIPGIIHFPVPVKRQMPNYIFINLPFKVQFLLSEVYRAFNHGLFRVAAMGIRSALEAIIIDKVDDQGSFISNLDKFQEAGYLSVRQRNALDAILEAGHAATHRGWTPRERDIGILWDITEHVIDDVYVHGDQASDLEKTLPRRIRPSKDKRQSGGK